MVAIKDANGKYTQNFRKCVIIEVVENQTSIRETVRMYWNVYTRREINLYTKTVRSWVRLYNKFGVYIMEHKKGFNIHLKKDDFKSNEELLSIGDISDINEANKIIKQLQLALMQKTQYADYYKKKTPNEEELDNRQKAQLFKELSETNSIKVDKGYLHKLYNINKNTCNTNLKKPKKEKYVDEKPAIIDEFVKSKCTYGYRRIHERLTDLGFKIGINKVLDLMNELNLHPYCEQQSYHSYDGKINLTFPNLINRNFKATRPYELVFSDVTMIKQPFGNVYLSAVLDAYTREIISYDISTSPNKKQAIATFRGLIDSLPEGSETTLHTDQGWQYKNPEVVSLLSSANIKQSMSRLGNCLDNAMMESWFGKLKNEIIYNREYKDLKDIVNGIRSYIRFYNEDRIHSQIDNKSPLEYKKMYYLRLNEPQKVNS